MDDQVFDLLNKRFDTLDSKLETINETIGKHIEKDEVYWKKIDQAEGQISLIKWVGSGVSISGALAWFFSKFGHQ